MLSYYERIILVNLFKWLQKIPLPVIVFMITLKHARKMCWLSLMCPQRVWIVSVVNMLCILICQLKLKDVFIGLKELGDETGIAKTYVKTGKGKSLFLI